jgi:hypothetical protein
MPAYVRICEFRARPGLEQEFERIYSPEGDWVQLFRKSKSFLRTELNCDLEAKGRYVTVDYFTSQPDYLQFLEQFREDYARLDQRCEAVRACETFLGAFTNHAPGDSVPKP